MPEEAISHNAVDAEKLKSVITRILDVRKQKEELGMDEKAIFAKADEDGLDPKKIKEVLAELKRPKEDDYKYLVNRYLISVGLPKKYAE